MFQGICDIDISTVSFSVYFFSFWVSYKFPIHLVFLIKYRSAFSWTVWNYAFSISASSILYFCCLIEILACFVWEVGIIFIPWVTLLGIYIPGILHIPGIHCSSIPKMSLAMIKQDSRTREGLDHYSLYKLSMWYWFISFITCANVVNGLTNISLKCL